jgi:hypothetical protein
MTFDGQPRIDQPQQGYYCTRLVRGGLSVGVRFFFDDVGHLRVEVDGRTARADGQPLDPFEIWPFCRPISEREFLFLARRREWAREHAPDHPAANPTRPVDLSKLPPRF